MTNSEIEPPLPPTGEVEASITTVEITEPDTSAIDCYECRACGYTYEPDRGDTKNGIPAGTAFTELSPLWRCPVCGAKRGVFNNVGPKNAPSGFKENLGYGFGVNAMTPSQKNLLIFVSLGLAIVFFLSLYSLN
jgi:rubredoxin